jgi:AcrR family transcriptional regulator
MTFMRKLNSAKKRKPLKRSAARAPVREDGAQTRQQLLEVAGRLFAEQGYAHTTSKQVCELADTNIAAVNYHFGGKDGLYSAVLEEAHARLVSIELVTATTQGNADPGEKLRILLTQVVGQIARRHQDTWALRVLGREIMAPTPMMNRMVTNQIMPKLKLVSGMIAGALGVPANHPAVSRCLLSIIGPCGLLLITTPELQKQVFPSLSLDTPTLVEHMVTFALGGLKTISASVRPARQTRQART